MDYPPVWYVVVVTVAWLAGLALLGAILCAMLRRDMQYWLPSWLLWRVKPRAKPQRSAPLDILFCIANHFEPGHGCATLEEQRARVRDWVTAYPTLAEKHRDVDGMPPKQTWFFPPHYDHEDLLPQLAALARAGFGEIEVHLHHDKIPPFPEEGDSFERKLITFVERLGRLGLLPISRDDGSRKFAFIHGDWALDNSRGGRFCGVNDEIRRLARLGCYADFTFPSLHESQPRKINSIYYATDDPERPKSYDTGKDAEAGCPPAGELLMIQGPIGLMRRRGRLRPSIECADISLANPGTPDRIEFWVRCGIHVKGQPNWVFVKLHSHGCVPAHREAVLGEGAAALFDQLERGYNDGRRYRLHYVTAREMYNIIRAAEAGCKGDPSEYRDFELPPPSNASA